MKKPLLVFDVESLGLHGEGFGFGYVVLENGKRVEEGQHFCPVTEARFPVANMSARDFQRVTTHLNVDWMTYLSDRQKEDWNWVQANVVPHMPTPQHQTPLEVRKEFWHIWRRWENRGATLWAEWAWPVEARFLAACVDDDINARCWTGPCPLHEIATLRRKAPHTAPRLDDEKPIHNPLADARQSARLLWEALQK